MGTLRSASEIGWQKMSDKNNEITISYGSFSITLAGEDKPFDLLRQVTDYYCYVAKMHPNFGAQPVSNSYQNQSHNENLTPPIVPPLGHGRRKKPLVKRQALEDDVSPNLWDDQNDDNPENQEFEDENPLLLDEPTQKREVRDTTQIQTASQALTQAEVESLEDEELDKKPSKFAKTKYPFRHFPLRQPTKT